MADQHNPDDPAVGNQIVADIVAIKETLEFHKDLFQSFMNKWSDTDATGMYPILMADDDLDTLVQVDEGEADDDTIRFDCGGTEQVIVEDGAVLPTTDDDIDLGGAGVEFKDIYIDGIAYIDYADITEYNNDATYHVSMPSNGITADAKFMLGDTSTIMWMYVNTAEPGWKVLSTGADTVLAIAGGAQAYNVDGGTQAGTWAVSGVTHNSHTHSLDSQGASGSDNNYGRAVANTGASTSNSHSSNSSWRPSASIGKLFQLDTA